MFNTDKNYDNVFTLPMLHYMASDTCTNAMAITWHCPIGQNPLEIEIVSALVDKMWLCTCLALEKERHLGKEGAKQSLSCGASSTLMCMAAISSGKGSTWKSGTHQKIILAKDENDCLLLGQIIGLPCSLTGYSK